MGSSVRKNGSHVLCALVVSTLLIGCGHTRPSNQDFAFLVAVEHHEFIIGPYKLFGQFTAKNASLAGADQAFGSRGTCRTGGYDWIATWPKIGVTGNFLTYGGFANAQGKAISHGSGCVERAEVQPDSLTLTDHRWHTAKGLHVGDVVSKMYKLYPDAAFHSGPASQLGGWWLQTRYTPFGTPGQTAALIATISAGRVQSLTISIDAEGD